MDDRSAGEEIEGVIDRILREHHLPVQRHFVDFMAAHLVDCCEAFDGDLHEMLVFTLIAQRFLREPLATAEEEGQSVEERRAISATRLATQSGIPRETVRRKLASLQARGWIEQTNRADWRLAVSDGQSAARLSLDDFIRRELRRLVKLARALKPFV